MYYLPPVFFFHTTNLATPTQPTTSIDIKNSASTHVMPVTKGQDQHKALIDNTITNGAETQLIITEDFRVPKALINAKVLQLAAMFSAPRKESHTNIAVLQEFPGVLTITSVCMMLKWLCRGPITINLKKNPEEEISTLIEMARLADYWMMDDTRLEQEIANKIREVVLFHASVRRGMSLDGIETRVNTSYSVMNRQPWLGIVHIITSHTGGIRTQTLNFSIVNTLKMCFV
jgi:hypothetical protein